MTKEESSCSPTTTTQASIEDRPLTANEIGAIRSKAKDIFQKLELQQEKNPTSWIRPPSLAAEQPPPQTLNACLTNGDDWLSQRSERCRSFDQYGFLHVANFTDAATVQTFKTQMETLANHDWDPSSADEVDSFGTDLVSNQARGDYFLDSANRVHYFAEPQALEQESSTTTTDSGTDIAVTKTVLKKEFQTDKVAALNKAGHAMHIMPGPFQDYTLSSNVLNLVTELGWQHPVVPQSMYIFKQPKIGGTVHSHQDSTFLYTTPKQSCLGLWLALDDATLENGCLWVRPASHREPLRRQFVRNPEYFKATDKPRIAMADEEQEGKGAASLAPSKLIFEHHDKNPYVPWEGGLPQPKTQGATSGVHESLLDAGFVPVECKAGDLVTFCGTLDHLSLPNYSTSTRHTFQLHLIEGPNAGVTWSPKNWLQYPASMPFLSLTTKQCG
jgi:phytanoyl-CoA hydroxylase